MACFTTYVLKANQVPISEIMKPFNKYTIDIHHEGLLHMVICISPQTK